MLHIVNGDCAIEALKDSEIEGDYLSWLDVLHDGPVPGGLSLEELSEVRAQFIVDCNWSTQKKAKDAFKKRDLVFRECHKYDEVVLWNSFELFDQLHILQLLDGFAQRRVKFKCLSIIFIDDYLGRICINSLPRWFKNREPVTEKQLDLGQLGWRAFLAQTPELMFELWQQDSSAIPFLQSGLLRLFEEFPAAENGLSRTENCILEQVRGGVSQLVCLFSAVQANEPIHFMGDWSFWKRVRGLVEAPQPLLKVEGDIPFYEPPKIPYPDPVFRNFEVALTDLGIDVLDNGVDWHAHNQRNFWIGGVHLHSANDWRWNAENLIFSK
ncbi:MAG: hypothetical protein H8E38_05505 [SAR324 cluster bacterium]|nr:hypothetical protein [SAR324 cluster bacterium]MBL7034160.1 hypothetical protein [SAR324 cluster bacterium]